MYIKISKKKYHSHRGKKKFFMMYKAFQKSTFFSAMFLLCDQ